MVKPKKGKTMATSQAQKKATEKWQKENYEFIKLRLNKGQKETIKNKAQKENKSINQYIIDRIGVYSMTVKEIIENEYNENEYAEYEVWQYTTSAKKLHRDFVRNIDEEYSLNSYANCEAEFYAMDEAEYNRTVWANGDSADFNEWYGNKDAKVLVIVIDASCEIE